MYSARYMGHDTSYDIKNAALLKRLEGVEGDDRSGRFVCAIAVCFPDGREIVKEARWRAYSKGNQRKQWIWL